MRSKKQYGTALIPYVKESGSDKGTPFARFIEALMARTNVTGEREASGRVWSAFPAERAIASGLWLLLIGLARTWGVKLTTEKAVLQSAARANVLLNIGLAVRYHGVLEATVVAWEKEVEQAIMRAFALGYRPGMDLPLAAWQELARGEEKGFAAFCARTKIEHAIGLDEVWQKPIAAFFAGLVKAGRAYISELEGSIEQFTKDNIVIFDMSFVNPFCWVDPEKVSTLTNLLWYVWQAEGKKGISSEVLPKHMRPQSIDWDRPAGFYAYLALGRGTMSRELDHLRLIRKLPCRITGENKDLTMIGTVDTEWLRTQIFLAAEKAPNREYISAPEYNRAQKKIRRLNQKKLVAAVMARLLKRGLKMEADETETLRKLIECLIAKEVNAKPIGRVNRVFSAADALERDAEKNSRNASVILKDPTLHERETRAAVRLLAEEDIESGEITHSSSWNERSKGR